jgi:hypothetical protein
MRPKVWGPAMWRILHGTSHVREPGVVTAFIAALGAALPCIHCRTSFAEFCSAMPLGPYLASGGTYSYWLYTVHNMVNDKLLAQRLQSCTDPTVYRRLTPLYEDVKRAIAAYAPLCERRDVVLAVVCVALNACEPARQEALQAFVPALGRVLVAADVHADMGRVLVAWTSMSPSPEAQAVDLATALGADADVIVPRLLALAKVK